MKNDIREWAVELAFIAMLLVFVSFVILGVAAIDAWDHQHHCEVGQKVKVET